MDPKKRRKPILVRMPRASSVLKQPPPPNPPLSQLQNPFAWWRKITYLLTQHKLAVVIRLWPDCGIQVDDIKTFSPNEVAAI